MRFALVLVIGALIAGSVVSGAWAAATITGADIVDGTIQSIDIGDKTVANIDLATDAVDGAKIKNLSIKTGDLGDATVTSGKIKDGTIQKQDIASGVLPAGSNTIIVGTCDIQIVADANGGEGSGTCKVPGLKDGDHVVATLNHFMEGSIVLLDVHSSDDCVDDPLATCWIQFHYRNLGDMDANFNANLDYVAFRQ